MVRNEPGDAARGWVMQNQGPGHVRLGGTLYTEYNGELGENFDHAHDMTSSITLCCLCCVFIYSTECLVYLMLWLLCPLFYFKNLCLPFIFKDMASRIERSPGFYDAEALQADQANLLGLRVRCSISLSADLGFFLMISLPH